MKPRIRLLLPVSAALVAALIAAAATWVLSRPSDDPTASPAVATVLPDGRPLPSVTLTTHNGESWTPADLEGGWQFVFFGFTHCPDVCPTTLADLAGALQRLESADLSTMPEVVFISVDPGRDTPASLERYVRHFHEDFIGVTGEKSAIDTLTGSLGIGYSLHEPDADGDYAVDHSAAILLIDPEGQFRAVWNPPHGRQVLAEEFLAISARYQEAQG